jgi:hypothetical protein
VRTRRPAPCTCAPASGRRWKPPCSFTISGGARILCYNDTSADMRPQAQYVNGRALRQRIPVLIGGGSPTPPGSIPFEVRARIPPVTPGTRISRPGDVIRMPSVLFRNFPVFLFMWSSTIYFELGGLSPREATDHPRPHPVSGLL